jgi:diguanylate cyclase
VISRIAEVLRRVVRTTDTIARLGGDEFAVILPGASQPDAELLAARILEATRARGRATIGQRELRITASIGATAFDASTGLTGAELVVEADIAMTPKRRDFIAP